MRKGRPVPRQMFQEILDRPAAGTARASMTG
jgi:hypothetical protein